MVSRGRPRLRLGMTASAGKGSGEGVSSDGGAERWQVERRLTERFVRLLDLGSGTLGTASVSFGFGGLPRRLGAVAEVVGAISSVWAEGSPLMAGMSVNTLARLLLS